MAKITLEHLRVLAEHAKRVGTERAWMDLALEWAEGANREIDRLKGIETDERFRSIGIIGEESISISDIKSS